MAGEGNRMSNNQKKITKHEKRSLKTRPTGISVFDLEFSSQSHFDDIEEDENILELEDPKEALLQIINCIHSLPQLFKGSVDLPHFGIYIGRTRYPYMRADDHWNKLFIKDKSKARPYFLPICWVPENKIKLLETIGIRYLQFLQQRAKLCVGDCFNIHNGSFNVSKNLFSATEEFETSKTSKKLHILYLSFKVDKTFTHYGEIKGSEEINRLVILLADEFSKTIKDTRLRNKLREDNLKEIIVQSSKTHQSTYPQSLHWHFSSRK